MHKIVRHLVFIFLVAIGVGTIPNATADTATGMLLGMATCSMNSSGDSNQASTPPPPGSTGFIKLIRPRYIADEAGLRVCTEPNPYMNGTGIFCQVKSGPFYWPDVSPGRVVAPETFVAEHIKDADYLGFGLQNNGDLLLFYRSNNSVASWR